MLHTLITGLALLASPSADACGGFFCQQVPVDQSAERIVFAIDEAEGTVEVHVQISYEGSAEDFAWVVPTPAQPELFTTVDDVFLRLGNATFPQWNVTFDTEGTCKGEGGRGIALQGTADSAEDDAEPPREPGNGVTVVDKGPIGPYEFEILLADDADRLLEYLVNNGYDLPKDLTPRLEPYVADGSYFVALRLQNDKTAGDLVPLGMTYQGTEPVIPIQLTGIAATPDLRLQPFVLASARAVPVNYMHVRVNPFAVNWLTQGSNYQDVVSRAADVAGGQAFATDYAGTTEALDNVLWTSTMYAPDVIRGMTRAVNVLNALQFDAAIPITSGTVPYITPLLDPPIPAEILEDNGITDVAFLQCIDCYTNPNVFTLDGDALADALTDPDEGWIRAMRRAQELVDGLPVITRLTSSMDADEMTLDPIFVLNDDMPDVDNMNTATFTTVCGNRRYSFDDAPRRLELPDGRALWLPAEYALDPQNFDYDAYIADLMDLPAEAVEQTGRSGGAQVVTDFSDQIADALAASEGLSTTGCGCDTRGGLGGAWLLGLAALGLRRRRD